MWENIEYFLKRVMPVAEEAKVCVSRATRTTLACRTKVSMECLRCSAARKRAEGPLVQRSSSGGNVPGMVRPSLVEAELLRPRYTFGASPTPSKIPITIDTWHAAG